MPPRLLRAMVAIAHCCTGRCAPPTLDMIALARVRTERLNALATRMREPTKRVIADTLPSSSGLDLGLDLGLNLPTSLQPVLANTLVIERPSRGDARGDQGQLGLRAGELASEHRRPIKRSAH